MLTEVTTGVAGTSDPVTGTLVRSAEDAGRTATGVSRGTVIGRIGTSSHAMATDLVGSSGLVTVTDLTGNSGPVIVTEDTRIGLAGTSSHVTVTGLTENSDPVTGMVTDPVGNSDHAMEIDLVGNSSHATIGPVGSSGPVTATDLVGNSDPVMMMHVTTGNRSMTRGGSSSRPIRRSSSSGVWTVRRTARTISR